MSAKKLSTLDGEAQADLKRRIVSLRRSPVQPFGEWEKISDSTVREEIKPQGIICIGGAPWENPLLFGRR